MNPVCVIFRQMGPYHCARLDAVSNLIPTLALELFGKTDEYDWHAVRSTGPYERITLFPTSDVRQTSSQDLTQRLHRLLDRHRPSAVVIPGWSDKGALAALSWCRRTATPAVVMSESCATDKPRSWPKELVKRRVLQMCSAGLVGGEPHASYLADLGMSRENIFTGYDVVDNDYFARRSEAVRRDETSQRARLRLPKKYFLASSRFIEKKNLPFLLEAYRDYRQSVGPLAWKLVLLGDGALRPELMELIRQGNLAPDVFLPGFQQYAELPAYYGLAGAFVHASTTEQWGLVVNEAMACGLPILVSDRCGCASDLIAEGRNGFTFDPHLPGQLSRLFRHISAPDCDLPAMGRASREIVARRSLQTFAANLKQAISVAAQSRKARGGLIDQLVLQALLKR